MFYVHCLTFYSYLFQKQLEDYLNNLLKMPMYRNYHATVNMMMESGLDNLFVFEWFPYIEPGNFALLNLFFRWNSLMLASCLLSMTWDQKACKKNSLSETLVSVKPLISPSRIQFICSTITCLCLTERGWCWSDLVDIGSPGWTAVVAARCATAGPNGRSTSKHTNTVTTLTGWLLMFMVTLYCPPWV